MGLPGLCASSCVLPVYVAGQRRSSPDLMSTPDFFVSSDDVTCGERRSLLLPSDISSALDVMQGHTHTPVLVDRRPTSEMLRSASAVGHGTLDPKALRAPISHTTTRGNTQTKTWIQNARSLHSLQMEALALKPNDRQCVTVADCFLLFQAASFMDNIGWSDSRPNI